MTQTAFSIGQRIYAALIRAANENPEGIAVRKNFSGGSRYGVDVGFPDWYREEPEKFASHPDDRGVLCMQIYVMPEDVGMEIKVRWGGVYMPEFDSVYEKDRERDRLANGDARTYAYPVSQLEDAIKTFSTQIRNWRRMQF